MWMRILKHQDASLKLLYSGLFLIAYVAHNGGVDSITAVLLKGYLLYLHWIRTMGKEFLCLQVRGSTRTDTTKCYITKDRIMSTLPHWDAFPNQEEITIYKSCQRMCLELCTRMLIRHTYICFQWNSMGPKNTDYYILLKLPHCRISW